MIARMWHGKTSIDKYDEYTDFLKRVAIPDYKKTVGFIDLVFMRRIDDNVGHFNLITFWENFEVIKDFAGQDFAKAKYYPKDEYYLLEFEEKVSHFEIFASDTFHIGN